MPLDDDDFEFDDEDDFEFDDEDEDSMMDDEPYPWPKWNVLGVGIGALSLALLLTTLALFSNSWASESIENKSGETATSSSTSFGLQEIEMEYSMEMFGETMSESATIDLEDPDIAEEPGEVDYSAWESSGEVCWWLLLSGILLLGASIGSTIAGGTTCSDKWRKLSIFSAIIASAIIIGGTLGWLAAGGGFGDGESVSKGGLEYEALGPSIGFYMALGAGLLSLGSIFLLLNGHELTIDRLLPPWGDAQIEFYERPYSPTPSMISSSIILVVILLGATVGGHWLVADLTKLESETSDFSSDDDDVDDVIDDDVEANLVPFYAFMLVDEQIAQELDASMNDDEVWTYEYDYSQDISNITVGQMTIYCYDDTDSPGDKNPNDEMDVLYAMLESPDGDSVNYEIDCDTEGHILELRFDRPDGLDWADDEVFRFDEVSSVMDNMTADQRYSGTWTITLEMDTRGNLGGTEINEDDNANVYIDDMLCEGYSLEPYWIGNFPSDWSGP